MAKTPTKNRTDPSASSPTDPVEAYARSVGAGETVAGPLVRLACERHLRDLRDGPKRGLFWDWPAASRAIEFFAEVLRLNGGEHEGRPFVLRPWQAFIVGSLFGWKLGSGGPRRFRVAFAEIGKGNGKSPLAAGIGIYLMCADNEPRAEVYAAAVTRDQAGILFRDAVAMVDQSPLLDARITRSGTAGREWNLADLKTGSFFRPISSDTTGKGKSGYRPHGVLLDELHEHPTSAMVEFMRAGTKGRKQALVLMITNSGWDRTSVCWDRHEYGRKVLEGTLQDDGYFAYICALDEGDVPFEDESCWEKANPNLGVSIPLQYLREQVREARGMPSKANLVRRLNFCEWTEANSRWISREAWQTAGGGFDLDELEGQPCVAGLDLSARRDLTALTLLFDGIDAKVYAASWFWLPDEGLQEREEQEGVPWTTWRAMGVLRTTPGASIDRERVADEIVEIFTRFRPWGMAYDRAKSHEVLSVLKGAGWDGKRFTTAQRAELADHHRRFPQQFLYADWGQGFMDSEPAVDALDALLADGVLRHGDNPITALCAANAMIETDKANNRKIVKERPSLVIDGIVAMAMAAGLREAASYKASSTGRSYLDAPGASLVLI